MYSRFRWSSVLSLLAVAAVVGCSDNATAPEPSQIAKVNSTSQIGGLGQIGNFVWNDLNANGLQDIGEPGIPGVVLNLTGSEVLTKTTSATGGYAFTGLTGGTYQVTVVPPAGMVASPTLVGADRGKDSNVSGDNVTTTASGATATNITIDFGFYTPTGKIGDFVWSDLNGNGIQDSGEPGIAGFIVTLNGPGGTKTAVTSGSGAYQFTGLVAGCYTVAATNPIGYAPTLVNVGSPSADSNANPASVCLATPFSVDQTADFGYIADAPQLRITKLTNNTDNNFVPGVMIPVGAPVTWTYNVTNTGNVLLTNVVVTDDKVGSVCTIPVLPPAASSSCTSAGTASPGQYTNVGTAIGTPPVGPPVSSNDPDNYFGAAPSIALIKRTNGTDNNTAPGPTLIVGSPVTWTYEAKNTGNVLLLNVIITDDKIGSVCTIPSLAPGATDTCLKTGTAIEGQYTNMGTATGSPPVGPGVSAQDPDNYNGILANTGSIGDFVWSDLNGNGVQDGGEPGIGGAAVSLTGPLGPMTTTTAANGSYLFSSLTAGCYTVTVASPASTFASPSGVGGDATKDSNGSPANVCLAANNSSDLTIDFGFIPFAPSISLIKTTNGTDNNSAPGPTLIVGTPVTWTYTVKNTGNVLLTGVAVTDDKVGAICVIASLAPGATSTCASNGTVTEGQYTNIGSVSGTAPDGAAVNAQDPDNYLGYVPNIGTIGDFVWKDLNANGVQDSGEPGLAGVVVSLNGPGGPQTATTSASGGYVFSLLTAGCYTVSVATPASYFPTATGAGTPATDSNVNGGSVCLPANNSTDATIDFGFVPMAPSVTLVKLTNGTDNNTAPGASIIVGSPVTWTYTAKNTGNVTLTNVVITDDKIGAVCTIASLAPGASSVCTTAGTATVGQYTNLGSVTGTAPNGAAVNAQDPDNYLGYVPNIGTIGDFVWEDLNANGVQDSGEPGLAGVVVSLNGPGGPQTATTNASGGYVFSLLTAGCYTVSVATPTGYAPTVTGAGTATTDSNVNGGSVCLPANNSSNLTVDFGFIPDAPSITILKKTNGTNNNTAPGPSIIVGAPVVWTYEVKNTGNVTLTNVKVTDNKIAGTICTVTSLAPGATTTCSSTGVATVGQYTNMGTATGTPPSGPNVTSTDPDNYFGVVPATGQIGDYVWSDENGDGIQAADEAGIGGLTVTLSGPVNATTVTDNNGGYLFSNLPAGTYTVSVATPTGYAPSPTLQGGNTSLDSNGSPATVTLATNSSVNLTIDFGFMPESAMGRMTGGGQQITAGGLAISRGFTLHCDIVLSNNLEVNWAGAGNVANNFHIIRPLQSATCINDKNYKQPPPAAPFNTFIGVARGKLNGVDGAMAYFTFIDDGEPGKNDLTKIQIFAPNGAKVLDVPLTKLDHGNIQAHYDQPHGSKAPK